MSEGLWLHVATILPILTFKLAVLFVGYLIARLGYQLLVKGISGQFTFSANFRGGKADLVSASPGIFFILMATILIAIAVLKDKPFETDVKVSENGSPSEQGKAMTGKNKPKLRKNLKEKGHE